MKFVIAFAIVLFASTLGYSQAECPQGMVCLSPQAARAALEAGDAKIALEKQVTALEQAVRDAQDNTSKALIELAKVSGENTILKQQQIRDMALVDLLLKQTKKKRNAFISIF